MDWDTILENLPIMARPETVSALEYARNRMFDRGDLDGFYEGLELANAIDVGFGLVKICFLHDMEWIDIPDDFEIALQWYT